MKLNRLILCVVLCMLVSLALAAQENGVPEAEEAEGSRRELQRIGIVFNTPSILLELEEYRSAGVGVKGVWDNIAVRGLVGLAFNTNNDLFGLAVGSALEFHRAPGLVSPYFGAELLLEYLRDKVGTSTSSSFGMSIGPLFGVEVAPFDIISIFAEYTLAFSAVYSSTSGPAGSDERWNYAIGTGLGNQGSIGIIVYFLDRRPPDEDTAEQ